IRFKPAFISVIFLSPNFEFNPHMNTLFIVNRKGLSIRVSPFQIIDVTVKKFYGAISLFSTNISLAGNTFLLSTYSFSA
ncbi:MAG: hypothetical protein AAGG59_11730, partial [Bacteroidota bacterium]